MSGVKRFRLMRSVLRDVAGKGLVLGLAAMLAACSGGVSRFDYPMFANNSGDDNLTTGSLSPVPSQPVYQNRVAANSSVVVKQDLPLPNSQVASADPRRIESAPLPPPQPYQAPSQPYQPPRVVTPAEPASTIISVRKGDTLYKIASRHDVTIDEIKSANSLKSIRLSIGQQLIIPLRDGAPPPATVSTSYTVKRGDSISRIARMYNISQQELQRANNITNPNSLLLGQVLTIPGQYAESGRVIAQTQMPVRVASRGPGVPLPLTNPARGKRSAPLGAKKTASRARSLPQPEPMTGNQFRWPVKGRIVSGFGVKPSGKHNDGINVAVPKGTSVKAAENGVVAYAGKELEPYGNLVLLRHANNWVTAYAHNDKLMVKRGDTVRRGQVIAKAGQTGNVSQPQLHFELRKGSKPINPLSYMASN